MVRIGILYQNKKGARFDFRYYIKTHMPLSITRLSAHPGFRRIGRTWTERGRAWVGARLRGDVPLSFQFGR